MRIGRFATRSVVVFALAACSEATNPESESIIIAPITNQLTGVVGEFTESPPAVRVTHESDGRPAAGVLLIFSPLAQSGTIDINVDTTDAAGVASAGRWRLSTRAGLQTVSVYAPAYIESSTLAAVARAGPLYRLDPATQLNQFILTGREPSPPSVRAIDRHNNGISGLSVAFTTAANNGTLGASSALTTASGLASALTWSIPSVDGSYSADATAESQRFTFTAQRIDSSALVWYGLDSMIYGKTYLPAEWSIKSKRLGLPTFDPCLCINKSGTYFESTDYTTAGSQRWEYGGVFRVLDGRISMDLVDSVHVVGNSVRLKVRDYYTPDLITWIYSRKN